MASHASPSQEVLDVFPAWHGFVAEDQVSVAVEEGLQKCVAASESVASEAAPKQSEIESQPKDYRSFDMVSKCAVLQQGEGGCVAEAAPVAATPRVRVKVAFAVVDYSHDAAAGRVALTSDSLPAASVQIEPGPQTSRDLVVGEGKRQQMAVEFALGSLRMPEGLQEAVAGMRRGELSVFCVRRDKAHRVSASRQAEIHGTRSVPSDDVSCVSFAAEDMSEISPVPETNNADISDNLSDKMRANARESPFVVYVVGLLGWSNAVAVAIDPKAPCGAHKASRLACSLTPLIAGHPHVFVAGTMPPSVGSAGAVQNDRASESFALGLLQQLDRVRVKLWVLFPDSLRSAEPGDRSRRGSSEEIFNLQKLLQLRTSLDDPFFDGEIVIGVHPLDVETVGKLRASVQTCSAASSQPNHSTSDIPDCDVHGAETPIDGIHSHTSPFHDPSHVLPFPSSTFRNVDDIMSNLRHSLVGNFTGQGSLNTVADNSLETFGDLLTPDFLHNALDAALRLTANVKTAVVSIGQEQQDASSDVQAKCATPGQSVLIFVDVVSVHRDGDIWHLGGQQLLDAAEIRRAYGSAAFKRGDVIRARDLYAEGLNFVDPSQTYKCSTALQKEAAVGARRTLLLNISACKLKLALQSACNVSDATSPELLQQVVHHCTEVIDDIPIQHSDTHATDGVGGGDRQTGLRATRVKALYRRAQAHAALGNTGQAAKDFASLRTLDPENKAANKAFAKFQRNRKAASASQRKALARAFKDGKGISSVSFANSS